MRRFISLAAFLALTMTGAVSARVQTGHANINAFFRTVSPDEDEARDALDEIAGAWRDGYTPLLVELARMAGVRERDRLSAFLEGRTGQSFGTDWNRWREWMWALPYDPHPLYGAFKGALYSRIDPRMELFFPQVLPTTIRMDEVEWGGVSVNGIPPLDHPTRLAASEALYLEDSNVVFGIAVNGEAMAYPKRVLAWHEMARDRIGGVELTIIYCTLCGTVLPYESEVGGRLFRFGTSGLLYRSNKLFFDEETRSLWSTLEGRPVIGWLAGQDDLALRLRSSVTTTWGEWRRLHPDTEVLSLDTGYDRDYSEGNAYRDYFSTDELMFRVSKTDDRLPNKAEVLVMLLAPEASPDAVEPWAIAAAFLERNRMYPFEAGGRSLVVITSREGANRVYDARDVVFPVSGTSEVILDETGREWRVTEDALVSSDGAVRLGRVTANRAFWFGWFAQFPGTQLIY